MEVSVLVIAAHPDDEVLGCGGTMAKLAAEGAKIQVAFLADGVTSRPGDPASHAAALAGRRAAAERACWHLGASVVHFGEFPDNRMDTVALLDVVRPVEYLIERYRPGTVLTHHAGDLNVDHRIVHQAVATACRPQAGHPVRTLLTFEVPSSTEWQPPGSAPAFVPDWFVDISGSLAQKLAALEEYASELRAWPHPRSPRAVEHLARWRGATIGAGAAEAFVLGRHLS